MARHEILVSTFQQPSGLKAPIQIVGDEKRLAWREIEIQTGPKALSDVLGSLLDADSEESLPVDERSPLRITLAKTADTSHLLVVTASALIADTESLHHVVSEAARMYASSGRVEVTDESHADGAAPPSTEHALLVYRIAQEALRNVVKHAGVSQCHMFIAVCPASIELRVTDQGKGFVADDSARGRGLGLISMAERARLADGRLEVVSRPGGGTGVRALIPRQRQS